MNDDANRFDTWRAETNFHVEALNVKAVIAYMRLAFESAERATAQKCAELADEPLTDSDTSRIHELNLGASRVASAIRAAFSDAFAPDPTQEASQ